MIQFDDHIFQMGWFNRCLVMEFQEVQADQTLPVGRTRNPELVDHPKDQPLRLV